MGSKVGSFWRRLPPVRAVRGALLLHPASPSDPISLSGTALAGAPRVAQEPPQGPSQGSSQGSKSAQKSAQGLAQGSVQGSAGESEGVEALRWLRSCCPELPRSLLHRLFREKKVTLTPPSPRPHPTLTPLGGDADPTLAMPSHHPHLSLTCKTVCVPEAHVYAPGSGSHGVSLVRRCEPFQLLPREPLSRPVRRHDTQLVPRRDPRGAHWTGLTRGSR